MADPFASNPITRLFGIRWPIIQAGMVWNAGHELASAVSEAGGLGIIGAGSMYPEVLRSHIEQCQAATNQPFAVNLPLIYPDLEAHIRHIIACRVPIVFTSAGNPRTWTPTLKAEGIQVVHVVSSARFAQKAEAAGVDAVVCEGFEAGGHNGREETTTFCLIPLVRKAIQIPLIAAGGIATGAGMLAAMVLGADGVQIGSRFAATVEGSGHAAFKQAIVDAGEGDTVLTLKQLVPVRMIRNRFYEQVAELEAQGANGEQLAELLGRGRSKRGMFEGQLDEGELEIGQVSALIEDIPSAAELVKRLLDEYGAARQAVQADGDRF